MLALKSWESLSITRRGWALGSIFGLVMTSFYLGGIPIMGKPGWRLTFVLLTTPALPGLCFTHLLVAPDAVADFVQPLEWDAWLIYVVLSTVVNYIFWGGFFAWLYRIFLRPKRLSPLELVLAYASLFFSIVGLSYVINCGLVYKPYLFDIIVLFTALGLALISLAYLLCDLTEPV